MSYGADINEQQRQQAYRGTAEQRAERDDQILAVTFTLSVALGSGRV